MEIDKIKFEEFEEIFVARALSKIRKLRTILVERFGIAFWKDIPIQQAMGQIFKEDVVLRSHQEVMDYCSRIVEEKMDINNPLWEFRIVEDYTSNTSLIIYRVHHSFIDGVGFGSLMSALSDNQFTSKLNRQVVQPSIIERIKYAFAFPMNFLKIGADSGAWCTDQNAKKIEETICEDDFSSRLFASDEYDFKQIIQCYRQYPNMTFNDFMLAILGKSLNLFYRENGVEGASKIGIVSLTNLRPLPTSYQNLVLDNYFVSTFIELPLQNDISKIHKAFKPWLKKFSAQEFIYTSRNFIYVIASLPKKLSSKVFGDV